MPDQPQPSTAPGSESAEAAAAPSAAPVSFNPALRKLRALWVSASARRAVCFAVLALLALNLLEFPRHPYNVTHDLSSHATFEYYAAHHFQFGKQVYQNVGPYGYVHYAYSYVGLLPVQKIVLKNASRLVLFLLVLWLSRQLPQAGSKFCWWAAFFIFQPYSGPRGNDLIAVAEMDWDQDYAYLSIYLAALYLLQGRKDRRFYFVSCALLFFLAFTALTKHTAFVLVLAAVGAISLQKFLRKEFWPAVVNLLLFICFLLSHWVLASQQLAKLPDFLRGIFAFASGYNEAQMEPAPLLALLSALLLLAVLSWRSVYNWLALRQGIARTILEIFILYIAWRHGFVRALAAHMALFFVAALFLATPIFCVTLPIASGGPLLAAAAMPPAARRFPWFCWLARRRSILAVALALSAEAIFTSASDGGYHPSYLWNRWQINLSWIWSPREKMAEMKGDLQKVQAIFSLPRMKAKVGNARVDYFGIEPGFLLLNEMNYWPRPMPMTAAAWNKALERANEVFYRNPATAPEYVVCAQFIYLQTDALALRALLDNYHPILREERPQGHEQLLPFPVDKELLLLERNRPPLLAQAPKTPLGDFTVRFGELFSLNEWRDDRVWMEVEIQRSWLGRLLSFCYKPALCFIGYHCVGDEKSWLHRFFISAGSSGCLLSPFIESSTELLKLYRPGNDLTDCQRVEDFALGCDPRDQKFFKNEIRLRFYSVPGATERVLAENGEFKLAAAAPALTTEPSSVGAHQKLGLALVAEGKPAEARTHFAEAIRLEPDNVDALNELAWLLATCPEAKLRDGQEALRLAKHAAQLTRQKDAGILETLAAACAEAGQFAEAIQTAEQALKLSDPAKDKALVESLQHCLELFRAGKALHL